jgi:hypothetical protein
MKISPVRFAFSALASLAMMGASADAATILIFGQQNANDVVTSTVQGNTTTFSSGPGVPAAPINVVVTNLGGVTPPPPGLVVPETFSFTSTAAITGSGGNLQQGGFSGSFSFGTQVVGTLTGGVLSTFTGPNGTTGSFNSSNVTFTTLGPAILAQLGITAAQLNLVTGTLSFSLNNINPAAPATLTFTAQNSGLITANVVPEPASVVMTSMALVAGLGFVGLRRSKVARA